TICEMWTLIILLNSMVIHGNAVKTDYALVTTNEDTERFPPNQLYEVINIFDRHHVIIQNAMCNTMMVKTTDIKERISVDQGEDKVFKCNGYKDIVADHQTHVTTLDPWIIIYREVVAVNRDVADSRNQTLLRKGRIYAPDFGTHITGITYVLN